MSVTGLIQPPPAPNPRPLYVENIPLDQISTFSAQGGNSIFFAPLPVLSAPLPIAVARIFINLTGGNVDVGIHRSDGVTLTHITSTGSTVIVAGPTVIQSINLLAPFTMQPGVRYFAAVGVNGATAQLGQGVAMINTTLSVAGPVIEYGRKASGFPIASSAVTVLHASDLTAVTQIYWVRFSAT